MRYLLLVLVIAGCSSSGPFVTNISSNGHGGLIVEKCKSDFNAMSGTASTGNCSTNEIQLFAEKK